MRLTFSSKDPCNTSILTQTNQPLYTVSSSSFKKSTTITRTTDIPGQEIELASFRFHILESDVVVLRGQEMRAKDWTQHSGLKRDTFTAASGRSYEWTVKLGTYKLTALEGGPVLAERPKKHGLSALRETPVLEVDDAAMHDLDDIVASFVYVTVRREKQKTAIDASTAALG